jgi:hypothetical protein
MMGVVVLAGLSAAVWYQMKADAKKGTATTTAAELPEIKGPEDIDKISITNGEKGEIVLEKVASTKIADGGTGEGWVLTKPVKAPANQANVKMLIDNMKELKVKDVVNPTPTEDVRKDLQLDPGHALHIATFKGGEKKMDDWFGKSSGRGEMVIAGDKPGIYAATGYSSYLYAREVKGWRDTEIFKFDDATVSQITIENAHGNYSFTKGDKWAATFKGHPIERFDEDKVKDLLRSYKSLNADDFGDGKSVGETGLDKPDATVKITLKDNAGQYELRVGKVQSGTNRYAQKAGDETVFVITTYAADWANAEETKFQKVGDAGAKEAGAPPPSMGGHGGMPPGHP